MPSSGSTTGAPITGGIGTGASIAEPLCAPLLSLPRWAQIIGINPVHFAGGVSSSVPILTAACGDVWARYAWQTAERASHSDLATAICAAEEDIARTLGYWPAPRWIAEEVHPYPRFHRPDMVQFGGLDGRGYAKVIRADYGYVIAPGQRAVTLVGTATVAGGALVYTDEDGDGFIETATVTMPTSLSDACEVKVFFQGQAGEPEWEIRPHRRKSISGGVFTGVFNAWLFIDPDLLAALPTDIFAGINLDTTANYVASVDVYREYNDTTATSATFYWEPETGALNSLCTCGGSGTCVACVLTTQDGCLHVRDAVAGMVAPNPAAYSDAAWTASSWSVCRDPDQVKLWYYAGQIANRRLMGSTCEPLSDYWAQTIAWLALARLEKPLCSCDKVVNIAKEMQADMSLVGGPTSYNATLEQLACPWGTRRGAVLAWQRVTKMMPKRARVALA